MKTENLEKTLNEYKKTLKEDLIKRLKAKGHIKSGELEKSIDIKIIKKNDGYSLDFGANEYLLYLDNGNFYKKWILDNEKEMNIKINAAIQKDLLNFLNI